MDKKIDEKTNIHEKLSYVQINLKVPKNRRASFGGNGGYNYRSCEDILEAVKPLNEVARLNLRFDDGIEVQNGLTFAKAIAILSDWDSEAFITSTGFAQIATDKKGMDVAQMTGSAFSYARKYALNGLYAIDDSQDIDSMDYSEKKAATKAAARSTVTKAKPKSDTISPAQINEMYKKSKNNKKLCLEVIGSYGYESGNEIKEKDYKEICDEIEERAKEEQ